MRLLPVAESREALIGRYSSRFKWLALFVVALGTIAGVLATTSFNVAVPAMSKYFGLGQDKVQWVITGFMVALTVAMLPTPWLLERFGFRRLFLSANFFLALFSIAGALSSDFLLIVGLRILQGITAGLLTPLPMLAVMRLFPQGTQGRAAGILTFGIVLAPAVSPSLSGLLLEQFGWQSIFLLNIPFCIITGVLGLYWLPYPGKTYRKQFDWTGVIILCVATLLCINLIAGITENGLLALRTILQTLHVVLLGWLFIWHARRSENAIVTPDIFYERSFATGTIVSLAYGVGLYASTYLIPVFMQDALGYDAALAGLALLPSGIVLTLIIPIAGVLADRYSPRGITVIGLAIFGFSFLLLVIAADGISYTALVLITIIGRIGLGLIIPSLTLAMLSYVQTLLLGQASMIMNFSRQLGGALGIAIVAVFVEWRVSHYGAESIKAYMEAFALIAFIFAWAVLIATKMKPRPCHKAAVVIQPETEHIG